MKLHVDLGFQLVEPPPSLQTVRRQATIALLAFAREKASALSICLVSVMNPCCRIMKIQASREHVVAMSHKI